MTEPAEFKFFSREGVFTSLCFVGLFVVYLATAAAPKNSKQNLDPLSALIPAWSLAQRGTLDIRDFLGISPWIVEHGELVLSDRMPGIIFWATPFYWLFGSPDGPSYGVAALAAATSATVAMLTMFALMRRLLTPTQSLIGTMVIAFGTATWTVSANALWPHGPDQMWLTLSMLAMASSRWCLAGLAFAAAVFTRPHLAVCAAAMGIWESLTRRSWAPVLRIGLISSLGVLAIVVYNWLLFGQATLLVGIYDKRPGVAAETASSRFDLLINVLGTLVSPVRGVLVLSPFLLALLPGLPSAWRVSPAWVRSAAVAAAAYMAVQLLGNHFAGGSYFYSYRLAIEPLTLCAPLLVLCWREWTSKRVWSARAFTLLSIFSIVQHAVGAWIFRDDFDFSTRAWSRYLLFEGLGQANVYQLLLILGLTASLSMIAWRVGLRR